jgi:hypothetical protein
MERIELVITSALLDGNSGVEPRRKRNCGNVEEDEKSIRIKGPRL